jgi:hypothetical protein
MTEALGRRTGYDRGAEIDLARARSQGLRSTQDGPRHHHAHWSRRFPDALYRTLTFEPSSTAAASAWC